MDINCFFDKLNRPNEKIDTTFSLFIHSAACLQYLYPAKLYI